MKMFDKNLLEICPKCGKKFICNVEEQVPGFRTLDEKCCPYCGIKITQSMEYEFFTRKAE